MEIMNRTFAIWSLVEILFIKENKSLGTALMRWLNSNFSKSIRAEYEFLRSKENPKSFDEFRPLLKQLIMRGMFTFATTLLSMEQHISAVDRLLLITLQAFPTRSGFKSNDEFEKIFFEWRQNCEYQYDCLENNKSLRNNEEDLNFYKTLFAILKGDGEIIKKESKDWKEALISTIIFVFPCLTVDNLYGEGGLINQFQFVTEEEFEDFDFFNKCLFSLFNNNLIKALSFSSNLDNWWLVSHLTDYFIKAGLINEKEDILPGAIGESDLREFYLLNYVSNFIGCSKLWKVCLDYLKFCPQFGYEYRSKIIQSIVVKDVEKLREVSDYLIKNDLTEEYFQIHKIFGTFLFKKGLVFESLIYYKEAKDVKRINMTCDLILENYFKEKYANVIKARSIFHSIENTINFFKTYFKTFPEESLKNLDSLEETDEEQKKKPYRSYQKKKEYRTAGKILMALLNSNLIKLNLMFHLILESVPLLKKTDEICFEIDEIYELMRIFEDILLDKSCLDNFFLKKEKFYENFLTEFRYYLVENLSRSVLLY
ncbi:Nucleoporin nup85 [Clydaea vesicula]|uniref:Nuclear pore complex protein Nup85 n=1 Tax=Clydaea vesicula TaxID=447962 RepID=A0AAD5TVG0_9FUNG|nr:Nucleoporin nup85 [Clydaea vesicula]